MHHQKVDLMIKITYCSKQIKYISTSFFYSILCVQKLGISCLSISTMSNVHCTLYTKEKVDIDSQLNSVLKLKISNIVQYYFKNTLDFGPSFSTVYIYLIIFSTYCIISVKRQKSSLPNIKRILFKIDRQIDRL